MEIQSRLQEIKNKQNGEDNEDDENNNNNDEVIKHLLLNAATSCRQYTNDDEKRVFLKEYFLSQVPALETNESLLDKFIEAAIEITQQVNE